MEKYSHNSLLLYSTSGTGSATREFWIKILWKLCEIELNLTQTIFYSASLILKENAEKNKVEKNQ